VKGWWQQVGESPCPSMKPLLLTWSRVDGSSATSAWTTSMDQWTWMFLVHVFWFSVLWLFSCLFVILSRFGSELQEYLLFNMNCSKHFGCLSGNVVSKFNSKEDGQQNLGGLSYCDKLVLSPTAKQAVNFSIFSDNQL
jgi:hypothetical protein